MPVDTSSDPFMPLLAEERQHKGFASSDVTNGYYYNFDNFFRYASGGVLTRVTSANDTEMTNVLLAIQHIETVFGLNRSQTAKALYVTRKSIYNWMAESTFPNHSNWERIRFLNNIADYYIKKEPLNRVGKLRAMINGVSVHQLLLDKTAQKEDFITFIDQLSMPRDAAFHKVANASTIKALKVKKMRPSFT